MKLYLFLLASLGTSVTAKQPDSYRAAVAVAAQVAPGDTAQVAPGVTAQVAPSVATAQESPQSTVKNLVHTLENDEVDVEIEVNKESNSGPLVFSISSDDHSCSFTFDSLQGQSAVSDSKFAQINGILFGTSSEIPDNLKENAELMQQIDCFRFLYDSLVAANSETSDAIRDFIVSQFYSQFMQGQAETASISAFNIGPAVEANWIKVNPSDKKLASPSAPDQLVPEDAEYELEDEYEDEADLEDDYTYQAKIGYINKVGLLNNFDKLNDVEYIGSIDTVTYIDDLRKIDNVGTIDKVEHIENIDDIKHTGNIKNIVNVGIIREIESLEDIKNIDNINKIENIKSLDNLEDLAKIEYIDNIESIKNVESLEDVQNINNVERINNIENISIFSLPGEEVEFTASSVPGFEKSDIENVEIIENIQRVENLRNLDSIGFIEDIKNIESVEHSKNMQAENVGTIENIEYVSNVEEMLPPVQEEAYMDFDEAECDNKEAQYFSQTVSIQALPEPKRVLSKHERPIFISKGSIENVEKVKNVEHIKDPSSIGGVKHIEKIHNVGVIDNIDNPKDIEDIEVIENVEVIKNINTLNSDKTASEFENCEEASDYSIAKEEAKSGVEIEYTGLRVQKVKQATSAAAAAAAAGGNGTVTDIGSSAQNQTTLYVNMASLRAVPTFLLAAVLAFAL